MDRAEAIEWLCGRRSLKSIVPVEPHETWQVRIAEADAAMTRQAYYLAKAYREGLLDAVEHNGEES